MYEKKGPNGWNWGFVGDFLGICWRIMVTTWYLWSSGVHIFAMKDLCWLGYIGDGILPRYMGIVVNHYHVGMINKTSMVTWRIIPGLGYVVRMGHPFFKPWSSANWKGSHNPTNWGLMITMVINHLLTGFHIFAMKGPNGCLGDFFGDYTTQVYRDYNKPVLHREYIYTLHV